MPPTVEHGGISHFGPLGGARPVRQGAVTNQSDLRRRVSGPWPPTSSVSPRFITTRRPRSCVDGRIVAAAQEERFTPQEARPPLSRARGRVCIEEAGIDAAQTSTTSAFMTSRCTKFERLVETYAAFAPQGFRLTCKSVPLWLNSKLHLSGEIDGLSGTSTAGATLFADHHESHAASAFFPSPVRRGGDPDAGRGRRVVDHHASASAAGTRSSSHTRSASRTRSGCSTRAFTYYTGFRVNSGEYKVMGLAPLRRAAVQGPDPAAPDRREGGRLVPHGHVLLQLLPGHDHDDERFHGLFGGPPREPEDRLTDAGDGPGRVVQAVCEEVMLRSPGTCRSRPA